MILSEAIVPTSKSKSVASFSQQPTNTGTDTATNTYTDTDTNTCTNTGTNTGISKRHECPNHIFSANVTSALFILSDFERF